MVVLMLGRAGTFLKFPLFHIQKANNGMFCTRYRRSQCRAFCQPPFTELEDFDDIVIALVAICQKIPNCTQEIEFQF